MEKQTQRIYQQTQFEVLTNHKSDDNHELNFGILFKVVSIETQTML